MGSFAYGSDTVTIEDSDNIVLERLPLVSGDREYFVLHRAVTYATTLDTGEPFSYTVPPPGDTAFVTDLASVPQLLTWLVPTSGRHLPAALVHDAMVDDPAIDRYLADHIFRDAMGDLDVGFIRRWLMWTAVTLETIRKRADTATRLRTFGSLVVIVLLGVAATINLATDIAVLPWMGSEPGLGGFLVEALFGLAGAVVIPIALGALLWSPVRMAGVIAGVAIAVLFHAMVLVGAVYGLYRLLESIPRRVQQLVGVVLVVAATVTFAWSLWR